MIRGLDDLRRGFDDAADVVVVGTGAAGAVAAANFAAAGLRTVVLEAGPEVRPEDMTRDAPRFLSKYYWEGGLRLIRGKAAIPSMQGRCLGGSTVMNSAIMLKLPDWVRRDWAERDGLDGLMDPALDRAFERIFEGTKTAPTPMTVMGKRNLAAARAMEAAGLHGVPLPRAVHDCKGCGDCLVGCSEGAKQSTDRAYIPRALAGGARVYTCAEVDRVRTAGSKAVGVEGWVVDPVGRRRLSRFTVRAPRVVLAAGVMATPVILKQSRIDPKGRVGKTFYAHLAGGVVGIMHERIEPWIGATQGWGAISEDIPGMKFECLWADPSVLLVKWGGIGEGFLQKLGDVAHMTTIAVVYRGRCEGKIEVGANGRPKASLRIPDDEARTVFRGMKQVADGLLATGARYVSVGRMPGVPGELRSTRDTEGLLHTRLGEKHMAMTANHAFGSCRMSADPKRGPVDPEGKVRGVDGLFVCDTSIFPSPSAVNPQATCMALSDVISRRIAELPA